MSQPTPGAAILGYTIGVATAALTFVAVGVLRIAMIAHGPLPSPLVFSVIVVVVYSVVTAFTALLPCLAAEKLAALLQARKAWYFALWGAATGVALGPCVLALYGGFATDSLPPLPALWVDRYTIVLPIEGPMFALSGLVGGLTYWWISSKRPITKTE